MKKVKLFAGRSDVKNSRLAYRDIDIPSRNKPQIKGDHIVMNEMEQFKELDSLDVIKSKLLSVLKLKRKSEIQQVLTKAAESITNYSHDMDNIGDGYAAKTARKMVKKIPKILDLMQEGPKVFFPAYKEFLKDLEKLDPSREKGVDESFSYSFEKNMDEYKNITPVKVDVENVKGVIITAPITLTLFRPLSDTDKVLLEKNGVKFAKGVGMAVIPKAKFFAINKKRFRCNYPTAIALALQAISKNKYNLSPFKDISKETQDAYCELIVPENLVRNYSNLFTACNKIIVHIQ